MPPLAEHFFRHAYGTVVATLCRRLGDQHLATIEDGTQAALMKAVTRWPVAGQPDDPLAWVFRVAYRETLGELRKEAGRRRILGHAGHGVGPVVAEGDVDPQFEGELQDDVLRMLFVCCEPSLPVETQLAMALKTVCGFGVEEIGVRLFTAPASVYKRLQRARRRLKAVGMDLPDGPGALVERRAGVHTVLYLLFTEGYLSSLPDHAIRRELCSEALRLGSLLVNHPVGSDPESFALLALMYLHWARMDAREDGAGDLVLLEEQDRTRWDRRAIAEGLHWLEQAAQGEVFSRWHGEASIAAAHCIAPSLEETRWDEITKTYVLLERVSPSPLHRLNRAVATAQWLGPEKGLEVLEGFVPPSWLSGSHMWSAVLADLHRRCGHHGVAAEHYRRALASAPSEAVRSLLMRRWGAKPAPQVGASGS